MDWCFHTNVLSTTSCISTSKHTLEPKKRLVCVWWNLTAHVWAEELRDSFFGLEILLALEVGEDWGSCSALLTVYTTANRSANIGLATSQMVLQHHLMRTYRVHVTPAQVRDPCHLVGHGFLIQSCRVASRTYEFHRADEQLLVRSSFAGVNTETIHIVGLSRLMVSICVVYMFHRHVVRRRWTVIRHKGLSRSISHLVC